MSGELKAYYDNLFSGRSLLELESILAEARSELSGTQDQNALRDAEIKLASAEAHYRERFCPLCRRALVGNGSDDEHHLVPRTCGGKEKIRLHRICHRKLHSLFSEKELRDHYNTVESIAQHPDMQVFIKWVKKKEPSFYISSDDAGRKR